MHDRGYDNVSVLTGSEWPVSVYRLSTSLDEDIRKWLGSSLCKCVSFERICGSSRPQNLSFLLYNQVELSSGNNVLYWRTTGFTLAANTAKPVLLKNISILGIYPSITIICVLLQTKIEYFINAWKTKLKNNNRPFFFSGVSYTSECFHCKPGTYSDKPGAAHCIPCAANSYSNKGATACQPCEADKYSGVSQHL